MKFEQNNPKTPASNAHQQYDEYKGSTINEATQGGANWQASQVTLLTLQAPQVMEVEVPPGPIPEDTPDCEAFSRAKSHAPAVVMATFESPALAM